MFQFGTAIQPAQNVSVTDAVVTMPKAKPRYFAFTAFFFGEGHVGADRTIPYKCIFSDYRSVASVDKEFWGNRFKEILPHAGAWLAILQNIHDMCEEAEEESHSLSYKGNYTVRELTQLPAATLYDALIRGVAFDTLESAARLEEVQMYD